MKNLETFLKLIIIGILTALVRTFIQGFIPVVEESLLWPSIFVEGGITTLAYMVFGSIFYTVIAALYLLLDKKLEGRRIFKGLKFSFLLIALWVPYLWEPLPHVTTMDKFLYPLADGGALLVMGILLGILVAKGKENGTRVQENLLEIDEDKEDKGLSRDMAELVDNILSLEEEEVVEVKEVPLARTPVDIKKSYPAKKKTYAPKKKSSGKRRAKKKNQGRKVNEGKKDLGDKQNLDLNKGLSSKKGSSKNLKSKEKTRTGKIYGREGSKNSIEKLVVADRAKVLSGGVILEAKEKQEKTRRRISLLNIMIIGLIFFLVRIAMYKYLRLYSSFGREALENLIWILGTGLVIGLVYELTTPYILDFKRPLKFLIFGALFFTANLVALYGFKPLIFKMDIIDLLKRTMGDVLAVTLGGGICTWFDLKK